jgi:MYXO-CTERM domain-containing protein
LSVLGLGYAGAAFEDPIVAIATAPAFGAAAVTLAAVALDRVGFRLESTPVAIAASALAGLGGLAAFLVVQRRRDRQAPA